MDARTIEKLTIIKLREEALKIPDVVGVHGMNKEELINLLKIQNGIPIEKKQKGSSTIREIKKKIKQVKQERVAAIDAKDTTKALKLRKKIKKLKRKTRH
ncbi:MAG: hypothetical protein A2161_15880 [Candidatus Schekmanbacteria bacterium RBG_13_48_7]|uniref:Rho termination factor N-terminal domain-containing protein n=1 Tax=Candidatus Schekmanbacteria bacterium RBG_13_48_7 TaxID=1817878 RepID=A0A1F7RQX3_9BACT|nr:MAG: hypothetical protein A2161_15880 [Candidatus Schekmanbacteria bacterium RBG_13_48_7]